MYKNLPEMKDGSNVLNLDEQKSIGTNWITSYVNGNNVTILTVWRLNTCQKIYNSEKIKTITNIYTTQGVDFFFVLELLIL